MVTQNNQNILRDRTFVLYTDCAFDATLAMHLRNEVDNSNGGNNLDPYGAISKGIETDGKADGDVPGLELNEDLFSQ